MTTPVRLGIRENAGQFSLLVALNALVGALIGLERSVLPLLGRNGFGLRSSAAILAFVVAFGAAKAVTNLAAGDLADRFGRRRLLVAGWLVALPVPLLIGLAPSWWFIVAANLLLGVNQGLAWSMTVVMKLDLAGPRRRGLALGLNEASGYLGLAVTAFASGALAATFAPRTVVWVGAALVAVAGLLISVLWVRDTGAYVVHEQAALDGAPPERGLSAAFMDATVRSPVLRACNQAGLVNNLNDALAWGLAPLFLAARGASVREIAVVAAAYPVVWGAGTALHRLALRPHGPQAADHGRHARPGGRARHARCRGRRPGAFAHRRDAARARNGTGLPDPDRRRLRWRASRETGHGWLASTASGATSASSSVL